VGGAGGPGAPGTGTNGGPGAANSCETGRIGGRAVPLAPRQYVNVLRDVVGASAVSDNDAAASGDFVFDTVDLPWITTSTLDRLLRLSDGAVESLRGKTGTFLGCGSLLDDACVRTGLSKVARRTFKRPVQPAELDGIMAVRQAGIAAVATDQGESAALAALQAILIAPSTIYRSEFLAGVVSAEVALTPHERAASIAAFLLDSVPDEPLMAAADDGSLMARPGLEAQVDRLLALPRVRTHLTRLILQAFNVPRVYTTPKDSKLFPEYTPALQTSMYEESRRFVEDLLWTRSAPLGELLTSRRSFVDASLAKLYGVAAPSGDQFAATDLPVGRSGILTHASVLSVLSRTEVNSVVARGLFMRGNVLCLPKIPGPPASVQAQVAAQLDAKSTQRELAAFRAMTSPCMGCHQQFDRFGLLLEAYDPIGRHLPAQAQTVDFTGLPPLNGPLADVPALTGRLEQDQLFERCLSDRTLSYALSVSNNSQERCLADTASPAPASGSIRDLVLTIVDSPAFNNRSKEP